MRRRTARPFGPAVSPTRLVSLLFAVALLYVFYDRAKEPGTWAFLTGDNAAPVRTDASGSATTGAKAPDWAKIDANLAPGPNDRDPAEKEAADALLGLVIDKAPLASKEMAAYWRLMSWARAEPFQDLEKRASPEVPFVQLWEQPDRYRGQLIKLRLHVARVLDYESPLRNDRGPPRVYEAWGRTDDSQSFPYVVVFPDLPEGLPTGQKAEGEIEFVGYFLKIMSYTPADASEKSPFRGAPLLVGRARPASATIAKPIRRPSPENPFTFLGTLMLAAGGVAIVGLGIWSIFRRKGQRREVVALASPADLDLGSPEPGDEIRHFDAPPPPDRSIFPPAPRPDGPA